MSNRTIQTITEKVAIAISSGETFTLSEFIKHGDANEYISFSHYNFFYSYPEFGKAWANGDCCEFHRVNTQCHLCKVIPERTKYGIGTLCLLNNGVGEPTILVKTGVKNVNGKRTQVLERIPNTANLSRMILLCNKCAGGYFPYKLQVDHKTKQISLF